jgi:membrane protein implicated in regulation of membrane protease activity
MLKYAHKKSQHVKTNADALVGKIGRVSVTIDGAKNTGRVSLDGDDWKAETENGVIINTGEKVEIVKVDSTVLIVKPIKKEE